MRDQRARLAFVGLILALPWIFCLRSPRQTENPAGASLRRPATLMVDFEPTPMVWWVEMLVVGGLIHVARERKRLLSARECDRLGALPAGLKAVDDSSREHLQSPASLPMQAISQTLPIV